MVYAQLPPGREERNSKANAEVRSDLGPEGGLVGIFEWNVLNDNTISTLGSRERR
jgi:hypothetical protein